MKKSLLSRLANYSLQPRRLSVENFTTEIIAHLYNEDLAFRRRFVRQLMPDGEYLKAFYHGRAETQVPFPRCIADIVLTGKHQRKHFIEVKISSNEAFDTKDGKVIQSQIDKYLDLRKGNVTFLTTRFTPAHQAELRGRGYRVHHAFFEQLYAAIALAPLTEMGKAFVEFMEEQDMAPTKPLSRKELRLGETSAVVYKKCLDILSQFKQEIEVEFKNNIRTRGRLTVPKLQCGPGWSFYDCYLRRFRHRGPVRSAGFGLEPRTDGIYFAVYVWGIRTTELKRLGEALGWTNMWDESKGFGTYFKLRGNKTDLARMKTLALRESRRLGRAIAKRY